MALKPHRRDPLPYSTNGQYLLDAKGLPVFEGMSSPKTCNFIVVACNSYYELLAVCKDFLALEEAALKEGAMFPSEKLLAESDQLAARMCAAIAKAEGRS